jgi:hypothetical protein
MPVMSLFICDRLARLEIHGILLRLGAVPDPGGRGWIVEPTRWHRVFVQDTTADIDLIPHDTLNAAGRAFGGSRLHKTWPRTHLTLSYRDGPGDLALRNVWTIGQAFLNRSPTVLDDHAGAQYLLDRSSPW